MSEADKKQIVDKFRLKILEREYKVNEFKIIELAKQCALICVEECKKANNGGFNIYWNEVKKEINKL